MFSKALTRRASPALNCYIHPRTHSRKALRDTAPDSPPLYRRVGKNQQKARQQITFPKLSDARISCQQQQTPTDGQAEDCIQSIGKDGLAPGKAEVSPANAFALKPSRSRKGETRREEPGSHVDVKENAESYATDSSIDARLSASKADVNTCELVACKHHAAMGRRGNSPSSDRAVFSEFNTSEPCVFAEGNDAGVLTSISGSPSKSGDPFAPLPPLEEALHNELLRKAKLVEGLPPNKVAILLNRRAFRSCPFEHLETMLQFLEEYHASSERALKVLSMNPGVLSNSVDLLQQKLQLLVDYQFEKETIGKLCTQVSVLAKSMGSLQEKLAFLEELGLDVEARNKIFYKSPRSIRFSPMGLKKTLDFFSGVGVDKKQFVRLVKSCPQLLYVPCDSNLIPRYHFFQRIGIPAVKLPRFVCLASRSSIDTIRERMQSIEDLGFSQEDVCVMVRKAPELLRSKVERLKVALDYLVHEQKFDMAEIVKYPMSLSSSFECRIVPRCRLAEEHGLIKVYSLASILSYPEARFKKLLRKPSDLV